MIRNSFIITVIALLVSIYFNISLFIKNELKDIDIKITKESSETYASQRNILSELIPELKPIITKTELEILLKKKYSGETVNVLEDHIQWRLYHFWFENEYISSVHVGS